ncbi:hypothetical protein QBC39DRAFT_345008 [Podospora conica]|nr:hypothetical protein QBC39DRAFT_345008 [Schizothecium conicum]
MRLGASPMTVDDGLRAQAAKGPRRRAGGTGGKDKMADKLTMTNGRASSTRTGSSSATDDACQSPPAGGAALRTAARKEKRTKMTAKKGESAREQQARTSHNMVEKEYRNRLHGYFEALLAVLPQETAGSEGDERAWGWTPASSPRSEGQRKKLSKADVLERACHHIEQLEEGVRKQRLELDMLKEALEC